MKLNKCYAADFETTTDENDCRVWAYSLCNVEDHTDFRYGNNIDDFIEFCANPKINYKLWFHNLKFDGEFILFYLLKNGYEWVESRKKRTGTFSTLISDMGLFYSIEVYFDVGKLNYEQGLMPLQHTPEHGRYGWATWDGAKVLDTAMNGSHGGYVGGTPI